MTDRMLRLFKYSHLPDHLHEVSQPFHSLASRLIDTLPEGAERTVALRRLLESKDAAVRSRVFDAPDAED